MKERPILFSGPMVRALLDGRKTQTRRIVKPQPPTNAALVQLNPSDYMVAHLRGKLSWFVPEANDLWPCNREDAIACPYGEPGDRLWVRETWAIGDMGPVREGAPIEYASDHVGNPHAGPWRPSIHMPRWASRITLAVTSVRVERLQEITEEDARAEGVKRVKPASGFAPPATYVGAFYDLWQEINGKRAPWVSNPWVWVIGVRQFDGEAGR